MNKEEKIRREEKEKMIELLRSRAASWEYETWNGRPEELLRDLADELERELSQS